MSWQDPGLPRVCRLTFTVLLAIPLALLALAPAASRAAAHPAVPTHASTSSIGKSSGPAMDITLQFDYHIAPSGGPFHTPYRMGTDAQGDLYVSDTTSDNVQMFDHDVFVRSFGTGTTGTGNGSFNFPEGIAANATTVFVADYGNHIIQTFNKSTGAFLSQFGAAYLSHPFGLALGSNGVLYVADITGNDIAEFNTGGTYLGQFGSAGTGNGQFSGPAGVAVSPVGYLYVTDTGNHRVEAFTLAGFYRNQWGTASFRFPDGIALDRAGMVYVVDTDAHTVYKFDPTGSLVGSYAAPASTPFVPGTFSQPGDVVAIPSTPLMRITIYVSDTSTGLVQRFDQVINPQHHTYQSQWGSTGSGTGQFNEPWATAEDYSGNVYVTDAANNRVQKFDQFGNFLLAFGSYGTGNGQFSTPTGVVVSLDATKVYVADFGNNRIEVFSPSGSYISQFGSGGNGNGQLAGPEGIARDNNYLYVADTHNNRIELFNLNSGDYAGQFGSYGSGTLNFNAPVGVAVDIDRQEVFIADYNNNRIQVFTTGGEWVDSVIYEGLSPFNGPAGVATDQRGDVYVAVSGYNQIYEMDVNITRYTVFGTAGSGNGQFSSPWGLSINPVNGQLYIADLGNNRIERFGSPWPKNDTIGIYRPSAKTFYLRNENSTGPADITVAMPYAQSGDLPVVGDWEGTGVDTVGLYRPSTGVFLLQDANLQESAPDYTFTLGVPGDMPIAGDWNGDGSDGAGIFRPSNGILYLRNSLTTGVADDSLVLGQPGDQGIAGDWNGDGQDSPGVYRPSTQTFYVTNKVTNGVVYSDASAVLGLSGDAPFTGDWVAQGASGIGVFRPANGITYEKNQITTGFADNNFIYGIAGDIPVAGQWIAPQVPFNAPPPHTSLGTRGAAPHSSTPLKPVPGQPGSVPVHTPSTAATPNTSRHKVPRAN